MGTWGRACPPSKRLSDGWSPGPLIFRSFVRFEFGLKFGLVLDLLGDRLELLLGSFWEPKSGQKCVLKRHVSKIMIFT